MNSADFVEIEHKFVVGADFDQNHFLSRLTSLNPRRQSALTVCDTYYLLGGQNVVARHRFDCEIQQLTLKSLTKDAEVRTEINIPIDQSDGNQFEAVSAFMVCLGRTWQATITKDIKVAYFDDCEVVLYRASYQDQSIVCVEFEAVAAPTIDQGLKVIRDYESQFGFAPENREPKSLFELLVINQAPPDIKSLFESKKRL